MLQQTFNFDEIYSSKRKSPSIKWNIFLGDFFNLIDGVPNNSIDLIICDGPYGINKGEWDNIKSIQQFNLNLIKIFSNKLKLGGALYLFGKHDCIDFIDYTKYLSLKNKIIWYQPSRLAQGRIKYTNNYDIICYFIKGNKPRCYNLEDIRVNQLVELEHRKRCEKVPSVKKGQYNKTKFNTKGKNPGDVWGDIKQLTYKSKELICREALNTIQKPEKLMERLIKASSNEGDIILDPFSGVGTCPFVCHSLGRKFIAFEKNKKFVNKSIKRLNSIICSS